MKPKKKKKPSQKPTPNPVGHPTDYRTEYCQMLNLHMEQGLSFESFAPKADVHRDTLYNWVKLFPEFSDAKKKAHDRCQLFWEKAGVDGLYNETLKEGKDITITRSINAAIWCFNMRNRFGWKDKLEISKDPAQHDDEQDAVKKLTEELKRLKDFK